MKNGKIEIMKNGKIESAKRFFIIYHFSFINQRSLTE